MWYVYRQNNSGGSFTYDASTGISVQVYVEADDAAHADQRAERIGIYFDGTYDCSCCGDRWFEADEWNMVDAAELPEQDAPITVDLQKDRGSCKWTADGEYEHFIHPLNAPFYGSGSQVMEVNPYTYGDEFGYGVRVWTDSISSVFPVNKEGWDKSGNQSVPVNGKAGWGDAPVKVNDDIWYTKSNFSGPYWAFWFKDKKVAAAFARKIRKFQKEHKFEPLDFLS